MGTRVRRTAKMWIYGERNGRTRTRLRRSGVAFTILKTAFTLIIQKTRMIRALDPQRGSESSDQSLSRFYRLSVAMA
jgi:hypothetical protein